MNSATVNTFSDNQAVLFAPDLKAINNKVEDSDIEMKIEFSLEKSSKLFSLESAIA